MRSKTLKPGSRGLFEAIKGLLQETDVMGSRWIREARGLIHVNGLGKVAMKKGVFHV